MEFDKKLKFYRQNRGFTQKELGFIIGVSDVTIGNWERGVKTPSLGLTFSLCTALQVSIDTLTGFCVDQTNRMGNNENEQQLIVKYRELDNYGRQAVDAVCDIEYSRALNNKHSYKRAVSFPHTQERKRYIPAYTNPSAAGIAVPLEGNEFEMIPVDDSVPANADFAVRIQGDSMMPYIEDGSVIFVDKDAELHNGDVGIFCVDGSMYCKQFFKDVDGNVYLLSSNPDRIDANIFLSAESGSEIRLDGKVIIDCIPLPEYFEH